MEPTEEKGNGIKDTGTSGTVPKQARKAKPPPPEPRSNLLVRNLVVASFWAVVLLLGLPVWWWTTSIHRATLPLQQMLEWADGKACKLTFPLHIKINAPEIQESEAQHLIRATQHALDDLNEFAAHHLRLTLGQSLTKSNATIPRSGRTEANPRAAVDESGLDEETALTVNLIPREGNGNVQLQTELQPHSSILDVYYSANQVPSSSSSSSTLANSIASELQHLFAEEQASIAYLLASSSPNGGQWAPVSGQAFPSPALAPPASREQRSDLSRILSPDVASKLARRSTRSLKYAPTYHLTFSLFTPGALPSSWEIEQAVHEYLVPLLKAFSISNFTVDTQVQLYAAFAPSVQAPVYDDEHRVWTLRNEDLSGFINAAEWPLGPTTGAGPTLNFILYVPDEQFTPLVVKDSHAFSWLVPQWGGVTILNPQEAGLNKSSVSRLSKEALQPALLTFSHQLLSLLGAPDTPASFPLQLQTLTRVTAASLLLSASSTMGSLARLTVALPSIAIPENVAMAVERTLYHLRETCHSLQDGRFNAALDHARIAEAEAEKGFFDPSMVGQVYFPDEHKVAVYLPLLGPIGVPLMMSVIKEAKRLYKQRKLATTTR